MSRLSEIQWDQGDRINDFSVWGFSTCKALVVTVEERIQDCSITLEEKELLNQLLCLLEDRLEEMETKLSEWHEKGLC